MRLSNCIKFQKTLALSAAASNTFEMAAAELAARRLMETFNIDPMDIPNVSVYNHMNFSDNVLLKKLRSEWLGRRPVRAPIVEQPKQQQSKDYLNSPAIPFSINGFRKYVQRKPATRIRANSSRDESRTETLRQLLNSGKTRSMICAEDGFNQGEISGIIRDYTGSQSAQKHFQANPKWLVLNKNGCTFYERRNDDQAGAD
jgi:hypothetical protein